METVRIELEQKMTALKSQVKTVKEMIADSKLISHAAFYLPEVTVKDENEKPDFIPVSQKTNFTAETDLKKELFRWYAKEGLSTKAAYRLPGYIQLTMPAGEAIDFQIQVEHLNLLKGEFKKMVTSIKNKDARFEIVHSLFPHIITLNVYRNIRVHYQPNDIRFYWVTMPRIENVDHEKLLKRLARSQEMKYSHIKDQNTWEKLVKEEINLIQSVGDKSKLRYIRPTKAQPMVKIDKLKPHPCPIPVILVTSNDEPIKINDNEDVAVKGEPSIKPLKDFNISSQRKGTGPKAARYIELVSRLDLFKQL